jgi:acetoin utilization deacetylase AcuC-like enzyme
MIVFHDDQHQAHPCRVEMFLGALVSCSEAPARVEVVLDELQRRGLSRFEPPSPFDDALLFRTHAQRYVEFPRGAWQEWPAPDPANAGRDARPSCWRARGFRRDRLPENFSTPLALFSFDAGTPLTCGSRRAACVLAGGAAAFALTRPPGHHAGHDFFGGYCFLNNAAIAAQALRDGDAGRVAVLNIDYHHGNGTQAVFYERPDVLLAGLHADPLTEYPFFLGRADETRAGAKLGFNLNLPPPRGSGFGAWRAALGTALARIRGFGADALVVSLDVDAFAGDPASGFTLASTDLLLAGQDIAGCGLRTVFAFEGGYAVREVGLNTANVIDGFLQRRA